MEKVVQKQENKMGTMPINKLLLGMSIPIVISMLVQACYNIVDSIFVAKLSEEALTSVSMAFPIQNLMMAISAGLGVGINARLAKALGEKNFKRVNKIAMQGIFLVFCGYLLFLVFGLFGTGLFMRSQTNITNIVDNGQTYLRICSIFAFGLFAQVVFERLLQSTGKTIYTMITQGTGAIINIILDPIMIFGLFGFPKMGVAGAAIATVVGQMIAGMMAVFFNFKKNKEITFAIRNIKPDLSIIWHILSTAIPSILMVSIGSVMTFAVNKILIGFTATAVAVFGVYFKLQSFVFMPVFGLNNGMIPIIAYNYGAQHRERVQKTIKLSVIYAVSIMLCGLAACMLIPHKLLYMFNASAEMIRIGVPALRTISLSFLFAGFCIVISSVCQALGIGIYSLIMSLVRQLVVLVPAAYLLSLTGKLDLVWLSFPIAEIASLVLAIIFLKKTFDHLKFQDKK